MYIIISMQRSQNYLLYCTKRPSILSKQHLVMALNGLAVTLALPVSVLLAVVSLVLRQYDT